MLVIAESPAQHAAHGAARTAESATGGCWRKDDVENSQVGTLGADELQRLGREEPPADDFGFITGQRPEFEI